MQEKEPYSENVLNFDEVFGALPPLPADIDPLDDLLNYSDKERLKDLQLECDNLNAELEGYRSSWDAEKVLLDSMLDEDINDIAKRIAGENIASELGKHVNSFIQHFNDGKSTNTCAYYRQRIIGEFNVGVHSTWAALSNMLNEPLMKIITINLEELESKQTIIKSICNELAVLTKITQNEDTEYRNRLPEIGVPNITEKLNDERSAKEKTKQQLKDIFVNHATKMLWSGNNTIAGLVAEHDGYSNVSQFFVNVTTPKKQHFFIKPTIPIHDLTSAESEVQRDKQNQDMLDSDARRNLKSAEEKEKINNETRETAKKLFAAAGDIAKMHIMKSV